VGAVIEERDPTLVESPVAMHLRLRSGMRKPKNWMQLLKFCAVGASGYVVNLCVFALCVEAFDMHHVAAATVAFAVAVLNNFWWNRHWTFGAREGHAGFQAARFFAVSLVAFAVAVLVLELLVTTAGMPDLLAQAISIVVATPLNFVGNKMWSFALELSRG
jgi:putative flippase GtrA